MFIQPTDSQITSRKSKKKIINIKTKSHLQAIFPEKLRKPEKKNHKRSEQKLFTKKLFQAKYLFRRRAFKFVLNLATEKS